jgi:tetratricopeptide (TPR) repeat protein
MKDTNEKDIENQFTLVCSHVYEGKIKSALNILYQMIRYVPQSNLFYQLENLNENYQNLLRYAYEGYNDPQRSEILSGIAASVINIADQLRHTLSDDKLLYQKGERTILLNDFGEEPGIIIQQLEQMLFSLEMKKMAKETGSDTNSEVSFDRIFRLLWLTDKLNEDLANLIKTMVHSETIEWYDKSLVASGLTLSLLRYFDPVKFSLLAEFVEAKQHQVYQRALVGLVIPLICYNRRIQYYPVITKALIDLKRDDSIQTEMEAIILQILMAQETEKINQEFEEEVLPEMKKMMPRIEDKLQLGNLFDEEDVEGKNPGWKDLIEEVPGLIERMEKFTRMQMEGGDVFMGTFSQLKKFDFFGKISNWFVPYYAVHPDLLMVTADEPGTIRDLLQSMDHAFYICNSDKYSFALNFMNIPQHQQSMIVTHFESELQQMKEMASEEKILGQDSSSGSIFIQYIQDLYRFYKLYPFRIEFDDFFRKKISFNDLYFYQTGFEQQNFFEKLAGFYFDNDHYPEALEIFNYLASLGSPKAEYFEKIAFSYQKMENYDEAITFYRKTELFDCDRLWVLKKLGLCSMKTGNYLNARKYFEDASSIKPDDLQIQVQIGQCCLHLKQFDEALEYFGKVRYYQPDNLKVLRPVAYCHFVSGKLDEAFEFYRQILASETASFYDLMNAGHVQLCLGEKKKALELYKKCLEVPSFTQDLFIESFEEDRLYLEKNGVRKDDLPLILDYLLFQNQ